MADAAIAGIIVGVVGIFCFCALVLVLGVLSILQGQGVLRPGDEGRRLGDRDPAGR